MSKERGGRPQKELPKKAMPISVWQRENFEKTKGLCEVEEYKGDSNPPSYWIEHPRV